MKKVIFLAAMSLLALLALTSCEENVVSTPVSVDLVPKAKISGRASAELNLQTAGFEAAPAGTELFVEVNYNGINADVTSGKWMDTIVVDANGMYEIDVPADANGVTVTISPTSFEADQVQNYTAYFKVIKKVYSLNSFTVNISSGNQKTVNFTYGVGDEVTFVDKVSITGKCLANLSAETPGLENAPNGTVLNFFTNDWKDSVAVNNGTYTIVVPNKTVNCKAQFTRLKKVWNSTLLNYQEISYKYTVNTAFTPNASINTFDISFGEGDDQTVDPSPNTTTLSGTATADSDLTVSGNENMPDGTKIYFEDATKTWGAIATVAAGRYSVLIPRNTTGVSTINYQVNYNANKRTSPTAVSVYNFVGSGSTSTTSASTKTLNITAN